MTPDRHSIIDTAIPALGILLGVAAMAGAVLTDEYAHAASAEAHGFDCLVHVLASPLPSQGKPHGARHDGVLHDGAAWAVPVDFDQRK